MINVTNINKPVVPAIKKQPLPVSTPTFKANLKADTFEKQDQKTEIAVTDKLKDFFTLPKVLRKNPELRILAEKAISGDVSVVDKINNFEGIKPEDLKTAKTYVKQKLLESCSSEPTPQKAATVVKMGLVPELTEELLTAYGRVKSLDEVPVRMKRMGWVSALRACGETIAKNVIVLETTHDKTNPLKAEADKQYVDTLKAFLIKIDKDQHRNNTNTYAKIKAIDLLKKVANKPEDIRTLFEVIYTDDIIDKVRPAAVEAIPVVLAKISLEPIAKAELESKVVADLKFLAKISNDRDLQLACYKAVETINK